MNQEQNNLNPNNFNTQGNNGILNNQQPNVENPQNITAQQQPNVYNPQNITAQQQPNVYNPQNITVQQPQPNVDNSQNITVQQPQPINNLNGMSSNANFNFQNNNQFNNGIEPKPFAGNYSPQNPSQMKNNKNIKIAIIIALIVVLLVSCLIFVIVSFKDKKSNDYKDPSISDAIIVKNSDEMYGIINSDGKQLTGFEYKSISPFLNGSAKVENSNNEVGIINSKGKMVVNFGKYKYITNKGYLYEATDKDFNKFLLNSKGKIIYDLKDASANSYIFTEEIVIVELENSIDVLDYEGNSLIKLDGKDNYELYEKEENYSTLYHNNISYIIDVYNRKIVHKEKSSTPYCVSSVNTEDKSKYVLTECEKPKQFMYMNNNDKLFTSNDCTNLFFEYRNSNLICAADYNRYIVDDKGNKGIEIYNSNIDYIDGKNYINKGENDKTEFYSNGKLIKIVDCTRPYIVASRSEGLYILENTCTENKNTYSYYDIKGNKKLKTNYKIAKEFDKNGLAIVSSDGSNKYLINSSGKKITKEYDNIDYNQNFKPINIYIAKKGNTTAVLNNKGKEILVTEGTVDRYDIYFTVLTNGETIYYNFDGKEIFKTN